MIKNIVSYSLCFILLFWGAVKAGAADIAPFQTQNQSPLVSVYGLPAVGEGAVLPESEGTFGLLLDLANHYVKTGNVSECLVLDGESLRLTISGRYGIGRRMELGVDIPVLITGGGFLDHFLESYHSTFGFPNGGRELAPKNRLLYRYEKNGMTLLNMDRSGQGPGDARLGGAWQIYSGEQSRLALRGSLKLPTGDVGSLRGSGSTDLALWVAGSWTHLFSTGRLALFGAVGAMGMTKGRVLPGQQRPLVGFGALGLGFCPVSWMELKVQTNAHTSFYTDSDLQEINAPSAQLTMGGTLHVTPKITLDIGLTEDIIVGTSPDVVFHLSLCRTF